MTVSQKIKEFSAKAEMLAFPHFAEISRTEEECTGKVLEAFVKNKVSEACFGGTSGYGYGDFGRDTLDRVYADVFRTQDALVRHNFVSGTHAISTAFYGVLRPGDTLVSVTGTPYDTLQKVIKGFKEWGIEYREVPLKPWGIEYREVPLKPWDIEDREVPLKEWSIEDREVPLKPWSIEDREVPLKEWGIEDREVPLNGTGETDGMPDLNAVSAAASGAKAVFIQRSRGYTFRKSFTTEEIGEMIAAAKHGNPDVICIVDNCYGEFTQNTEPTDFGADLCIGSLIKNPGGGIASTGGYIAGKAELVGLCADRLSYSGAGKDLGCSLGQNKEMFLGLFLAPQAAANALKTSAFASELFTSLGYECLPRNSEKRADIITVIKLGSPEKVAVFCKGLQAGSPVDSFVCPQAWDMPGYDGKVIMAAGGFNMGASIELSADAPMRQPYAVWLQGGLTYPAGKIGIISAAQALETA
ncbi:MAG: methionine gamma-lyase family protein [Oscillospiraceae bacterium]|jgi:cystathionine beta-lyase family protein involved in aluminum resistance|nr:methionine gamma-lyase family protein [Oscillospiraceae bacterium]